MINNIEIKELRLKHGLTQEQLAKALFMDVSTISKYESGKTKPSVGVLEELCNVFGYTLEMKLIEKVKTRADVTFYNDKTPMEVVNLSDEDMLEYLFIKVPDEKLCKICKVSLYIYNKIPLVEQKNLLRDALSITSKESIYHILNDTFTGVYWEFEYESILEFIDMIRHHIDYDTVLDEEESEKIYYFEANAKFWEEESMWVLEDIKLYDKKENLLDIDGSDIDSADLEKRVLQKYLQNGAASLLETGVKIQIRVND